jgi:hypothetical protein
MVAVPDAFASLPPRLARLRLRLRAVRRAAASAREQTDAALVALGVARGPEAPVIDVDTAPRHPGRRLGRRAARAVVRAASLVTATLLLGLALWALGVFTGLAALAFLVATRGLGLRIDLAAPRPA